MIEKIKKDFKHCIFLWIIRNLFRFSANFLIFIWLFYIFLSLGQICTSEVIKTFNSIGGSLQGNGKNPWRKSLWNQYYNLCPINIVITQRANGIILMKVFLPFIYKDQKFCKLGRRISKKFGAKYCQTIDLIFILYLKVTVFFKQIILWHYINILGKMKNDKLYVVVV